MDKKEFEFYQDVKVTVWARQKFTIEAESKEEALKMVEKFKKEVPLYMLKHTLRPGITGLAQIKGLRGDTSIADRIEEDINYIENWSFWGDIRIILLTPFKAINRHEKYVAHETAHAKRQEEKEKRTYVAGTSMKMKEERGSKSELVNEDEEATNGED